MTNEAVLRRLRSLLERKRDLFRHYLTVLEQQELDISGYDIPKLEAHLSLETEVLKELQTLQRIIEPLELDIAVSDLTPLQQTVSTLSERIGEQHTRNRELLSRRTEELAQQIDQLNIPVHANSVYSSNGSASLVDMVL